MDASRTTAVGELSCKYATHPTHRHDTKTHVTEQQQHAPPIHTPTSNHQILEILSDSGGTELDHAIRNAGIGFEKTSL